MMSRRKIFPSLSSSRQMMMAWKVSGLSQRPAIMASRPASMRLAMAISPSRDNSSTVPISRRYIRTGSSVRSPGSDFLVSVTAFCVTSTSSLSGSSSASSLASSSSVSLSSDSMTLIPMSESSASVSSIASEVTSSEGRTALSCS